MALIAAVAIVSGTAAFGQTRFGRADTPLATRNIVFPFTLLLDLPRHFAASSRARWWRPPNETPGAAGLRKGPFV